MTSWRGRIDNVPAVLDTILAQTIQPDAIVINLAEDEFVGRRLPEKVQEYIDSHDKIQINWRKHNTTVYKKILPTLLLYPEALILPIDDDILYPPTMIDEFMKAHKKYPDSPISGNKVVRHGIQYHCGCASLIQAKHLAGWEKYANDVNFRQACLSDDVFNTYLAAKNGYLYETTDTDFMATMIPYNSGEGYSKSHRVKLNVAERVCYNAMGMCVEHYPNHGKPYCVFGSMQTERGKKIEELTLRWLRPYYDVYVVKHDGRDFEYTAIKFMHDFIGRKNASCLYLHTKGACNQRECAIRVRRMWRYEFTERQKEYLKAIEGDGAIVATPYTGKEKVTWFNGWFANAEAIRTMNLIKTRNRFWYEYELFKDAEVKGMRLGNIVDTDNKLQTMHADLIKYFGK